MNVLSLFDGISCGRLALQRAGFNVDNYYASEIDQFAMQVSKRHWPSTVQLGSVTGIKSVPVWIDLLIGGSPCQGFSFAGKQLNFNDPRSVLFFEFVRLLDMCRKANPNVKFLLENVVMKKQHQDVISKFLGVQPIEINSNLVSAQNRRRLYWTNIEGVKQPADRGILLKDIILPDALPVTYTKQRSETAKQIRRECFRLGFDWSPFSSEAEFWPRKDEKSNTVTCRAHKEALILSKKIIPVLPIVLHNLYGGFNEKSVRVFLGKSPTLRANSGGGATPSFVKSSLSINEKAQEYLRKNHEKYNIIGSGFATETEIADFFKGLSYDTFKDWDCIRHFDPVECERLQTLPDNYTAGISNTQRYKAIGNGWTIEVIAHILSHLGK